MNNTVERQVIHDIENRIRWWLNTAPISSPYWVNDLYQNEYPIFDGFIFDDWCQCVSLAVDGKGLNQKRNPNSYIYGIEKIWVIIPEKSKSCKTELKKINPEILQIYGRCGGYFVDGPWWEILAGSFQNKLQNALDKRILDQTDKTQLFIQKQDLELNKKRKQFSQSRRKQKCL